MVIQIIDQFGSKRYTKKRYSESKNILVWPLYGLICFFYGRISSFLAIIDPNSFGLVNNAVVPLITLLLTPLVLKFVNYSLYNPSLKFLQKTIFGPFSS